MPIQDNTRKYKTTHVNIRQHKTTHAKTIYLHIREAMLSNIRKDKTRQDKTRQDNTIQYNTIEYKTI